MGLSSARSADGKDSGVLGVKGGRIVSRYRALGVTSCDVQYASFNSPGSRGDGYTDHNFSGRRIR